MTSNQTRAILLARDVLGGQVDPGTLDDHDWMLLVLAAGLSCAAVAPAVVSRRVLENASARAGYFGTRTRHADGHGRDVFHA